MVLLPSSDDRVEGDLHAAVGAVLGPDSRQAGRQLTVDLRFGGSGLTPPN